MILSKQTVCFIQVHVSHNQSSFVWNGLPEIMLGKVPRKVPSKYHLSKLFVRRLIYTACSENFAGLPGGSGSCFEVQAGREDRGASW
jgi:hypothetical protein